LLIFLARRVRATRRPDEAVNADGAATQKFVLHRSADASAGHSGLLAIADPAAEQPGRSENILSWQRQR